MTADWLQRGRGRETAESRTCTGSPEMNRLRFNGAAVVRPRRETGTTLVMEHGATLQRGRGRETAESNASVWDSLDGGAASTGPRS